jgi:hypothetical protein
MNSTKIDNAQEQEVDKNKQSLPADNREKNVADLDQQLLAIQRSTKTLFPQMTKLHNLCRMRSTLYYRWDLHPSVFILHWLVLVIYTLSISAFLFVTVLNSNVSTIKAASSMTWGVGGSWDGWEINNLIVKDGSLQLLALENINDYTNVITEAEEQIDANVNSNLDQMDDDTENFPVNLYHGFANYAYSPFKNESVDWLSFETLETDNGQKITKEFYTIFILLFVFFFNPLWIIINKISVFLENRVKRISL